MNPARIRIRLIRPVCAIVLLGGMGMAHAQTNDQSMTISADEQDKAGQRYPGSPLSSASNTLRHIDGAKGWEVVLDPEPPLYAQAFPDRRQDALWQSACSAAVFGEAELTGKKSFIGHGDTGVYTKLRFKLFNDWRANTQAPGNHIDIIVPGGEVKFKGEAFKVVNHRADFQPGRRYVLIVGNKTNFDAKRPVYDDVPLLEIQGGAIYSRPGWTLFANGTSIAQAKAEVGVLMSAKECK